MKKRIFSLILAVALCMSCLPTAAFASDGVQDSGEPAIGASGLCEHHVHDESCGEEGADCAFVCEVCGENTDGQPTEEPSAGECTCESEGETHIEGCALYQAPAEPACTCGTDDQAIHSTLCPAYTAPENPECFCVEQCPEDAPNEWCDVCGVQGAAACKGGGDAAAAFAVGDSFYVDYLYYKILTEGEGNNTVGVTDEVTMTGTVDIPTSVTHNETTYTVVSVLEQAFNGNTSLTSVTIPDSVTSIGASAFYNCTALTSITIPDSVTSIGDSAFYKCESLASIAIPDGVASIGDYAFGSCSNLTSITIPDSVTSLGEGVFNDCTRLQSATLPDNSSFTVIPDRLFSGCHALTSVSIPDGVTGIGEMSFYSCSTLRTVTIPALTGGSSKAVLTIGANAFERAGTDTSSGYTSLRFTGGTMDVVGTANIPSAVVTGGSINFTDAPEGFSVTDDQSGDLYLNTISFRDFSGSKQTWMSVDFLFSNIASATTLSYYGTEGMMTDTDGKLYLWLSPATTLQGASSGASGWQYTDGDSSTENDSFITQMEASDLVFEPYLTPGTSFPITVDVLGYSNAKGFIYAQGASLNKDSTGLSVGEKGKTYYLMIDGDSTVPGVNPLPDGYSVVGLYLNEEPPTSGYSIQGFTTGQNSWTEDGVTYGGTTYQFTMPEEAANITAVFSSYEAPTTTYSVTVNPSGNGTVSADKTTAAESDTVTLTFSPAEGYEVGLVSVTANGSSVVTTAVNNNQCTFIMPAGNVTVTATFSLISTDPSTGYNLWVGGTEVTDSNLFGAGWAYEPSTRTLELTNAEINGNILSGGDLNIVFRGINTVSGMIMASDLSTTHYTLIISGTGSLTAATTNPNGAIGAGSITLGDGLQITQPEGGWLHTGDGIAYIVDSDGGAAKSVTLESSAPADTTAPTLTGGTVDRTSDTEATVRFTSDEAGLYTCYVMNDSGNLLETTSGESIAGENTITLTGLASEAKVLMIQVTDVSGNPSNMLELDIPAYVPEPELTAGEVSRTSDTEATVKFTSSQAGTYSYTVVPSGSTVVGTVTNGDCIASENTITLTNLNIGAQDISIQVTNTEGKKSDWLTITIPAYQAPDTDDTCITIEGITENGEYPLGSGIGFTATGKGMDNDSPDEGDQQCRPFHWKVLDSSNAVVASGNWVEDDTIPMKTSYAASINTDAMAAGQYTLIVGCSLWEWQSGVWTPDKGFEVDDPMNTHFTVSIGFSVFAYSVTGNLANLSLTGASTVAPNTAYTATLTAAVGYSLPDNITVTVGGTELTGGYSWNSSTGALAIEAASVTGDITITATGVLNTYSVTFDANGGEGSMAAQTFTHGVAQSLTANSFTRSGYVFTGWNTEADGGGTAYSDGQSVALTTGGMTLYAQWVQIPAAPTGLTKTDESIKGRADGSISGVDNAMEYSTDGGATWQAVTGSEVTGLAAGTVKVRVKAADSVPHGFETELTIGAGPAITVKFVGLEGCTNPPANQIGLSYGTKAATPPTGNPVMSDYEFLGWYDGDGETAVAWDFNTTLTDANIDLTDPDNPTVTIYAKWKQVQFTVGGTVSAYSDDPNNPGAALAGVSLKLVQGQELLDSTTSGENGVYTFNRHVPVGIYNIVAIDPNSEDHTKTDTITVTDHNIDDHIIMPPEGVNSHLDVGSGELASQTVVGGLDEEALALYQESANQGEKISVSMGVNDKTEAQAEGASDIKQKAKDDDVTAFKYLDITVSAKIGTDTREIKDTANIMWIIVPFNFSNVDGDVFVYRHHIDAGGSETTDKFTQLSSIPSENSGRQDKTYYIQKIDGSSEGYIHICGDLFSTYAIGYNEKQSTDPGGNGGNGGGGSSYDDDDDSGSSFQDENYDFWKEVREKIEDAKDGDTVKANARWYDQMPVSVMKALLKNSGVTLIIDWNGGDRITIPAGKALIPEAGRIYYPLSYLEGIDFGALAANIDPTKLNPETGGDLYEIMAPAVTNSITTPDGKPEITDPRRGTAATIEDAEKGIEKAIPGVFEPVTEAPALDVLTEQQSKSGGLFAGIAVLLAALAAGGGSWVVWKKRKTAKR